jgi:hypothetical protein
MVIGGHVAQDESVAAASRVTGLTCPPPTRLPVEAAAAAGDAIRGGMVRKGAMDV